MGAHKLHDENIPQVCAYERIQMSGTHVNFQKHHLWLCIYFVPTRIEVGELDECKAPNDKRKGSAPYACMM